jgi:Bifunctional DNA primase/polymerase, N-terminal
MGSPQPLALAFPRFLSYGWALVPVRRGEKAPDLDLLRDMYGDTRIAHLRHAPALAGEVELWFENEPEANLAVIPGEPSRLVVADVDRLDLLDPDLPTPTASSGREGGGKHLYFLSERPIGTKRMPWGHVNPAYVLLPGSLHPSGRRYAWLPGRSPEDVPFRPFEGAAAALGAESLL